MAGSPWTDDELARLRYIRTRFPEMAYRDMASLFPGRSKVALEKQWQATGGGAPKVGTSVYPVYDNPLVMEGDALVIPDPEVPFHHAEFLNRVIDLAIRWGITQAVIAGDAVHLDSLSGWQSNWLKKQSPGGLSDEQERGLVDWAMTLSDDKQAEFFEIIGEIGEPSAEGGPNAATELREARKVLKDIGGVFTQVDFVLGNHEGRLLRTFNSPLFADDLSTFLGLQPKWRIAPFYFSWVVSGGEKFRITHPRPYGRYAAQQLADKYQAHILMGHSHRVSMIPSKSGRWMGWQIGATCDERRMPYAAQRDTAADAHSLGAAIIRDGHVWVLTDLPGYTDWDILMKL